VTDPLDSISDWRRVNADEFVAPTALDLAPARARDRPPAVGLRVAVHGPTATLHDRLDDQPGAFERLLASLASLRADGDAPPFAFEVTVVEDNRSVLLQIVDLARSLGARGCIFATGWATPSPSSSMASLDSVIVAVQQALAHCQGVGLRGVVHDLPACLLSHVSSRHDVDDNVDDSPPSRRPSWTLRASPPGSVDPPSGACLFAGTCALADRCAGLPLPYIHRFGYEAQRLRPVHRSSPWPRPVTAPAHAQWRALLGPAAARVVAVVLERHTARFTLELGGGRSLVLELTPRDDRITAFARSRTFDLRYTRAQGLQGRSIARIVEPIAAAIAARDDGTLHLDPRRDLPPLPPR